MSLAGWTRLRIPVLIVKVRRLRNGKGASQRLLICQRSPPSIQVIWNLSLKHLKAYPDKPIIIAGDDDISQSCKMKVKDKASVNVGRGKGVETAKAVGGVAVFPVFAKVKYLGKDELSQIKPAAYLSPDRLAQTGGSYER